MAVSSPPDPVTAQVVVRRARLASGERRDQLVQAAIHVIAQVGIHTFRLVDVGRRAGVSQALVSAHFSSRDELIAEAFVVADARAKDVVTARAHGAGSGRNRVLRLALECLTADPEVDISWALWHQLWSLGHFSPTLGREVAHRQQTWAKLFADAVREGQVENSIAATVDAEHAGVVVVTLLDGLAPALRHRLMDAALGRRVLTDAIESLLGDRPGVISSN